MKKSINTIFETAPILLLLFCTVSSAQAQKNKGGKKISTGLFRLFSEDINYAADGSLYAELVQNRSFEYTPTEHPTWNPNFFWQYVAPGFSYGRTSVETAAPIHPNNPHYLALDVEHVGHEKQFKGISEVGLKNYGFGGIFVNAGDTYHFSMYTRQPGNSPVSFHFSLQTPKGKILAETTLSAASEKWKRYSACRIPEASHSTANLVIPATTEGKIASDMATGLGICTVVKIP